MYVIYNLQQKKRFKSVQNHCARILLAIHMEESKILSTFFQWNNFFFGTFEV